MNADQLAEILHGFSATFAASQQVTNQQLAALLKESHPQGSGGYTTKPPIFRGDGVDDVDQFLSSFDRYANFFSWPAEKRMRALPLSLANIGHANIWFNSLDDGAYESYDDLTALLRNQFDSSADKWLLRQELTQRKQGATETVADFSADVRRQCQRLRLAKTEWLHILIQGLRPDIRSHIVLQQPDSFEQAERMAKLKEAVSKPAAQAPLPQAVFEALISQLQPQMSPQEKPAAVAAFTANANSFTAPPREEPLTESSIRKIIQQELRQALRDNANMNRGSSFPRSDNFRYNRSSYNGRNDNSFRNRRTPEGHPICNTCNRRGHTSYNCRSMMQPQRDPRLPRENRNLPRNSPSGAPNSPNQQPTQYQQEN